MVLIGAFQSDLGDWEAIYNVIARSVSDEAIQMRRLDCFATLAMTLAFHP